MEYREIVQKSLISSDLDRKQQLLLATIGLQVDVGGLAKTVRRAVYDGEAISMDKLTKDLGELRKNLEIILISVGATMHDIEFKSKSGLLSQNPDILFKK
jgi:hypothetical protein